MSFRKVPDPLDKIWESKERSCKHPDHEPPTMIVLQPGTYEWTCPACGAVRTVRVPAKRWSLLAKWPHHLYGDDW